MAISSLSFTQSAPMMLADALDERLRQARPRLLRMARAFGIPSDHTEDIAQETCLRAWRKLADVREADRFDAWLNAICRSQCLMYLRAQRRTPEPLRLSQPDDGAMASEGGRVSGELADSLIADPLDVICAGDAALLLERAFAYLAPQERALLQLRYLHERPLAEIAHSVGVTPHVLEARLHRARVHLSRALAGPLRRDAEDFGLTISSDDGWRVTRIGCYLCGRRKLLGRFEAAVNGRVELRLRCSACSARSTGDIFRSKGIAQLDGLHVFRPALTRSLRALAERTQRTLASGYDVCLHCGHPAPRRVAAAEEFPAELSQARRHWVVAPCPQPGCPGLGAWAALDSVIGAEPMTQSFISDHPRWVTAPEEVTEWQGRSVIRFELRDLASAAQLTLLADRRTLQTLTAY